LPALASRPGGYAAAKLTGRNANAGTKPEIDIRVSSEDSIYAFHLARCPQKTEQERAIFPYLSAGHPTAHADIFYPGARVHKNG